MEIKKTNLPKESLLFKNIKNYNYIETFQCIISDFNNKLNVSEIGEAFVQPGPEWFEKLMTIRDRIVSVFGLKTSDDLKAKTEPRPHKWEPGEQAGIFEVFDKTENEIILGGDDKHLNARVSLLLANNNKNRAEKTINVSTVVEFNNLFGNFYFLIIKPFHKAFIPYMLKKEFTKLESEINS